MPLQPVFTRPSALLAPYISYLFELESAPPADAEPHRVNVLPVPHAQMVFSFGGPSFERVMGGEQKPSPDFALTGYTTRTMEYSNPGHLGVVMAGFHPWGLQPFFEKPLRAIIDRNVLLSDVCRGVVSFERDLRDASDPQARIQCIERFLLANLRRPALDEEMVRSATTIMEAKGSRRVQELADALSMSRRQYLRRFQDTMGVDPSLFTQLVRFQSTFEAMDLHGEAPDWPAIALDAGYYDQAHFINAFRSFTGLSPTEYLVRMRRTEVGQHFDAHRTNDDPMRRMYI
ncbi:MAG: AraC family transcriptional regulator [Flavobacteriales bacterium]|jgi:AraC-like DNA-binding protein|nr:AraC family transcriptional regulator [Flavobacteriales bacterium]MBK6550769.1 AraC family transcriptional regulator [Flavobacteriales bacterium]MBK6883255.1 AraC family transcriptional regulator [Flavobacteriales bacterium]MBK7103406.1 AraC family transcriptional regulator [Flavobacteriales bacterium]MBK7113992.1 AraC family transcriptional regulator [Flavobacteriales bacterium]